MLTPSHAEAKSIIQSFQLASESTPAPKM